MHPKEALSLIGLKTRNERAHLDVTDIERLGALASDGLALSKIATIKRSKMSFASGW
jgi:hypothetical protein